MKAIYFAMIVVLLNVTNIQAQHTKKAHKAAKRVHREARLTVKDHNQALKLEKKRVSKYGV